MPVSGVDNYTISFDLLRDNAIPNAARELCLQKQTELGLTTVEQGNNCIANVEQHITAVLLANKIVGRNPSRTVTVSCLLIIYCIFLFNH